MRKIRQNLTHDTSIETDLHETTRKAPKREDARQTLSESGPCARIRAASPFKPLDFILARIAKPFRRLFCARDLSRPKNTPESGGMLSDLRGCEGPRTADVEASVVQNSFDGKAEPPLVESGRSRM